MIEKQKSAPVSDESQVEQYKMLMKEAKGNGYVQYEISNFCKPGRHAIHNTSYWKGIPYLGLGPSAHSYDGNSRRWNISNLTQYIDGMNKGEMVFGEETLTINQKYNEYVMTSLRTAWGCSREKISSDFGFRISDFFRKQVAPMIEKGLIKELSGVYCLTDEGKLFADSIAAELFLTD
jgi:oxygen-independent coproporphyrinogen-3 oxidase